MKAQLSFEFMLYLTVAALALSTALLFSARAYSRESALDHSSAIAQFVAGMNFNMQYISGSFYAYIPPVLCGLPISGSSLRYGNTTYQFYGNVSLAGPLCPGGGGGGGGGAGGVEELSMTDTGNGTYSIEVV